jgi:tripartite-type tricarboxylate transporter receptor subunit TctC
VATPEMKQRIMALSITPKSNTSDEFHRQIETEILLWMDVAQEAGIEPN